MNENDRALVKECFGEHIVTQPSLESACSALGGLVSAGPRVNMIDGRAHCCLLDRQHLRASPHCTTCLPEREKVGALLELLPLLASARRVLVLLTFFAARLFDAHLD